MYENMMKMFNNFLLLIAPILLLNKTVVESLLYEGTFNSKPDPKAKIVNAEKVIITDDSSTISNRLSNIAPEYVHNTPISGEPIQDANYYHSSDDLSNQYYVQTKNYIPVMTSHYTATIPSRNDYNQMPYHQPAYQTYDGKKEDSHKQIHIYTAPPVSQYNLPEKEKKDDKKWLILLGLLLPFLIGALLSAPILFFLLMQILQILMMIQNAVNNNNNTNNGNNNNNNQNNNNPPGFPPGFPPGGGTLGTNPFFPTLGQKLSRKLKKKYTKAVNEPLIKYAKGEIINMITHQLVTAIRKFG